LALVPKTFIGELSPNQETKDAPVHDGLAVFSDSIRQIHQGLGASGAIPEDPSAGNALCGYRPLSA
jgi:hypothetical protein